jgi:hypothetical protein
MATRLRPYRLDYHSKAPVQVSGARVCARHLARPGSSRRVIPPVTRVTPSDGITHLPSAHSRNSGERHPAPPARSGGFRSSASRRRFRGSRRTVTDLIENLRRIGLNWRCRARSFEVLPCHGKFVVVQPCNSFVAHERRRQMERHCESKPQIDANKVVSGVVVAVAVGIVIQAFLLYLLS